MNTVYQEAQRLVAAGICVLPIKTDGSKSPSVPWSDYQKRLPTPDELRRWFDGRRVGIAIMGGSVSGDLLQIDFDDAAVLAEFEALVEDLGHGESFRRLSKVVTPSGAHFRARVPGVKLPTEKLARRFSRGKTEVLIETRSEGAIALCPPSPAACHPLNLTK